LTRERARQFLAAAAGNDQYLMVRQVSSESVHLLQALEQHNVRLEPVSLCAFLNNPAAATAARAATWLNNHGEVGLVVRHADASAPSLQQQLPHTLSDTQLETHGKSGDPRLAHVLVVDAHAYTAARLLRLLDAVARLREGAVVVLHGCVDMVPFVPRVGDTCVVAAFRHLLRRPTRTLLAQDATEDELLSTTTPLPLPTTTAPMPSGEANILMSETAWQPHKGRSLVAYRLDLVYHITEKELRHNMAFDELATLAVFIRVHGMAPVVVHGTTTTTSVDLRTLLADAAKACRESAQPWPRRLTVHWTEADV
jgi:hypothetical protein